MGIKNVEFLSKGRSIAHNIASYTVVYIPFIFVNNKSICCVVFSPNIASSCPNCLEENLYFGLNAVHFVVDVLLSGCQVVWKCLHVCPVSATYEAFQSRLEEFLSETLKQL